MKRTNKSKRKINKKTRRKRKLKGGNDFYSFSQLNLQQSLNYFNDILRTKCADQSNNRFLYLNISNIGDDENDQQLCLNVILQNAPIDLSQQILTRSKRSRPDTETVHDCISKIEFKLNDDPDGIVIDSRTLDNFQRHYLNTLLRSLIILLGKKIDPNRKYIASAPMNYLSAYTLVTKFNGQPYDLNINQKINTSNLKSVDDYKKFYELKRSQGLDEDELPIDEVRVELNYRNSKNAYEIFMNTLNRISCEIFSI